MKKSLVVHIILNSHLDPIWLWGIGNGIDEVVATSRAACDLLDDYPQLHITRGEAWFYETLEQCDPQTFSRVQAHVRAGRWHIVGGWYVQPDCNLASPETYMEHSRISAKYFKEKFGIGQCQTGYNVDSFGHGAFLPDFYADAGFRNYCFMRPDPHEKTLPGEIFRWRSPNGKELLTARIHGLYTTNPNTLMELTQSAIDDADREIGHTMLFVGMGDHGAGPTRIEVKMLLEHWNDWKDDNVQLVFSHPDAFFDAVRPKMSSLPVVSGELQFHSIGCYSALSAIKRGVRETENQLVQFGHLLPQERLDECWKRVLFATFHDVLAGTAVASAMPFIYDSLAASRHEIWQARTLTSRRANTTLPPAAKQRIVLDNFGRQDYHGNFEYEPWLALQCFFGKLDKSTIRLQDECGKTLPMQLINAECTCWGTRMFFPIDVPAGSRRVITFDYGNPPQPTEAQPEFRSDAIDCDSVPELRFNGKLSLKHPTFTLIDDTGDTWSHVIDRYPTDGVDISKVVAKPCVIFDGPLVRQLQYRQNGSQGECAIETDLRLEAGFNGFHYVVNVLDTLGPRKILKMNLAPGRKVVSRRDGVSGGAIERALDGKECPFFNFITLTFDDGDTVTIVTSDCTACDVQADGTLRLTLLRTPYYSHHQPFEVPEHHIRRPMDQQAASFRIAVLCNATAQMVQDEIYRQMNPLTASETTLGMLREIANAVEAK